jgi:N-acyl-D-aspartate/D-glutamate deacylase
LDHRILGATVVDGTGAPAYTADLGIRDGRIVAIVPAGTLDEPATETHDAAGLVE